MTWPVAPKLGVLVVPLALELGAVVYGVLDCGAGVGGDVIAGEDFEKEVRWDDEADVGMSLFGFGSHVGKMS